MKFIRKLAAGLALEFVAVAAPAGAVTWTQVSDYVPPAGPISTSAYPGAAQAGGWYDPNAKWSIASGQLVETPTSAGNNGAQLLRPAAENAVDAQIRTKYVQSTSGGGANVSGEWNEFRMVGSAASQSGYLANCDGGSTSSPPALQIFKLVSGALTQLGSGQAYTATNGTSYVCVANVVQATSTSTTITVTLYASDGVTVLATYTQNDTTASLQNVAGAVAIYQYANPSFSETTNFITELTTYSDVAAAATSYGFSETQTSGPTGVTTTTLAVAPNGVASSLVVTPSDASGGTFAPTSATLNGTQGALFTYTPASAGSKTLSAPNGSGLTAPSMLAYTATVPPVNIAVNSPAWHFSPYNWKGDTGRGGSVYRQTWNAGAYATVVWTASSAPTATVLIPTNSSGAVVSYVLNGVLNDGSGSGMAASGNLAVSGIKASATNTLTLYLRSAPQGGEWNNGGTSLQIQGLQVDGSGSASGVAPVPTKLALFYGDSITVSFRADNGTDNFLHGWSFIAGQYLVSQGFDYGISASSGEGFLHAGDGSANDVPVFYSCSASPCTGANYSEANSRWDKIDAGVSLLDTNAQFSAYGQIGSTPNVIVIAFGYNDYAYGSGASLTQASMLAWLQSARAAAGPLVPIVVIIEDGLYGPSQQSGGAQSYVNAIKGAVAAANDPKVVLQDNGLAFGTLLYGTPTGNAASFVYTDGTHPMLAGHALIASRAIGAVQAALNPTLGPFFRSTIH